MCGFVGYINYHHPIEHQFLIHQRDKIDYRGPDDAGVHVYRNDQVQLAWFGGLSGVKARLAVPGSKAIALGEEDTQFISFIIANASTGLTYSTEFPEGIAGKTFTFGSK